MGAKDRIKETASDLAHGVKSATEDVSQKARTAVEGLLPGEHGGDEEVRPTEPGVHKPAPASGATPTPAPTLMSPSGSSADPSEGDLREVHPDPKNKAGVRDTAGDRADHQ